MFTVAGVALLATCVGASVLVTLVSPLGAQGPDPSMKATLLSQGISEVINCAALLLVAAAAAAGIWGLARWRLRVGRKSAVM